MKKTKVKRGTSAKSGLMSPRAAVARANQTGKEYFQSVPKGTWIECDWDASQNKYDNCHEVPASEVPKAWGGDGA